MAVSGYGLASLGATEGGGVGGRMAEWLAVRAVHNLSAIFRLPNVRPGSVFLYASVSSLSAEET